MFGLKIYIKKNILYPHFLFPNDRNKFPEKPVSKWKIQARLFGLINILKENKKHSARDNLFTYPHTISIKVWQKMLPFNPNNSGNWTTNEMLPQSETQKIEKELIHKMIDLYGGQKEKLEGYVTSGATESNIFSAWLGRKFLEKKGIKIEKICLLKTNLTHYSIEKAADIIGVKTIVIGLNEITWGMDVKSLINNINILTNEGYRGFLICFTDGYTATGTKDNFEELCCAIKKIKKRIKNINFFLWIDAALNGLIEPFVNNKYKPFGKTEIQTFLTDFHKFGFTPLPSGIILYRKELRKLIEKPIDYLRQKDNTLLGSRSGIAPVVCWTIVEKLGKQGFRKIILKNKKMMNNFITKYSRIYNNKLKFVFNTRSLSCGIIIKNKGFNLKNIENKHGIKFRRMKLKFMGKYREILLAKIFFIKN